MLPTGTLDYAFHVIEKFVARNKKDGLYRATTPEHAKIERSACVFSMLATPYYDCMWAGMGKDAGDLTYRLMELVPENLRDSFDLYPKSDLDEWHTIQDFMADWETDNPDIQTFPVPEGVLEVFLLA